MGELYLPNLSSVGPPSPPMALALVLSPSSSA